MKRGTDFSLSHLIQYKNYRAWNEAGRSQVHESKEVAVPVQLICWTHCPGCCNARSLYSWGGDRRSSRKRGQLRIPKYRGLYLAHEILFSQMAGGYAFGRHYILDLCSDGTAGFDLMQYVRSNRGSFLLKWKNIFHSMNNPKSVFLICKIGYSIHI